jgi:hypothetical protein
MSLSFTIAAGPRQRSHPQVRVSFSRLPNLEGQVPVFISPRKRGDSVIPPGTRFPFRCLLRLAGLRWRYWNGRCERFGWVCSLCCSEKKTGVRNLCALKLKGLRCKRLSGYGGCVCAYIKTTWLIRRISSEKVIIVSNFYLVCEEDVCTYM